MVERRRSGEDAGTLLLAPLGMVWAAAELFIAPAMLLILTLWHPSRASRQKRKAP